MELFVIQCTTCRARLKVHDPAVIGQIVECPKCRSFVAVTAPAGWQSPAKSSSSAAAQPTAAGHAPAPSGILSASGSSVGAVPIRPATAGLHSTASSAPVANAPVSSGAVARSTAPPPLPKKTGSSMAGISSSAVLKTLPQQPAAQSAGRAAAAVGAWAPAAARQAPAQASTPSELPAEVVGSNRSTASLITALLGRYRWWVAGSMVGLLAAASAAWWIGSSHGVAPTPDQPAIADRAAELEPGDKQGDDRATTDPMKAGPAPATPASALSDQGSSAVDSAAAETQPVPPSSSAPSAERDRLAVAPDAPPANPTGPGSYETAGGSPETSTGSAGAAAAPMEEELGEAESFDPVKQARLMMHLTDKLGAVEFTGIPLGQFVVFLSEFSTVPMEIDAQSLAEVGKSVKTRISVKLDDATVEAALKAALNKPGLAFHIEPGRLVITSRAAKSK